RRGAPPATGPGPVRLPDARRGRRVVGARPACAGGRRRARAHRAHHGLRRRPRDGVQAGRPRAGEALRRRPPARAGGEAPPAAASASLAQIRPGHVTRAWALQAATLIVVTGTSAHVKLAAAAAFGDAALSAVEGLALRWGKWWAPWLVVAATSVLLPWELYE